MNVIQSLISVSIVLSSVFLGNCAEPKSELGQLNVAWVLEIKDDSKQVVEFDFVNNSTQDLPVSLTPEGWVKGVTVSLISDTGLVRPIEVPAEEVAAGKETKTLRPGEFVRHILYVRSRYGDLPRGRYRLAVAYAQVGNRPREVIRMSRTLLWLDIDWLQPCYDEIPEFHKKPELVTSPDVDIVPVYRTSKPEFDIPFDLLNIGNSEIRYFAKGPCNAYYIHFFVEGDLRFVTPREPPSRRSDLRILAVGDFVRNRLNSSDYSGFKSHCYPVIVEGDHSEVFGIGDTPFKIEKTVVLHLEMHVAPQKDTFKE